MDEFNAFLKEIPRIEGGTNYWFFRTMGGKLFKSFFDASVIALGYSEIDENTVKELIEGDIDERKKNRVTAKIPDQKKPGLVINTLKRFYTEMKTGDYVIMPEYSCKTIAIGEIISGVERVAGIKVSSFDEKEYIDKKFQRSRKIKWLKKETKGNFSPELYGLFNTHQTISLANGYAHWINNILYSFYETEKIYHYVINVKQKHDLSAKNLYGTLYDLLGVTDEFLKSENINENTSSINTKISLNSPGYIELFGISSSAIVVIALILFINGGGFKIKITNGFELDLSTNGLIKRLNEFFNSRSDRKLKKNLAHQLNELKIKDSGDIVNILEAINKQNQNDK
jgi:hypothetical protein